MFCCGIILGMFDLIVITAANAAQARGYRAQTKDRNDTIVVADPGGRRVGSLGATVNVLRKIAKAKRRARTVLICHSGGDSRRTPGYAALGKAFIPLRDGRPMFTHIVEAMERLALPKSGGVLVVSGDVLPTFAADAVSFSSPGVTGVAYAGPASEARRHGVYITAGRPAGGGALPVSDFLQKPDVTTGTHLIDTGVMFIDAKTARKMTSLPIRGDIYEEFPKMLLEGYAPFNVNIVPECDFFHVGSTREIVEKLGRGGTYSDAVHCELEMDGDNVATNIPPGMYGRLHLKKGECITCIPVRGGKWREIRYNIDDNFKTDGLWEKHGMAELIRGTDYTRLLGIRAGETARVTAPVRIDLAGGWSDTPPICQDNGGAVLNAAVTLDGERPIEVTVSPRKDKFVKIVSKDLGKRRLVKSADELADHSDPHDWCALVKSALAVTGFRFGERGLNITICANLPKGSGMGTSSILGAATIAAILRDTDRDRIGELALQLEREMCTGGGWQDQFGGITPGVKLLTSKPGEIQSIAVKAVDAKWLGSILRERGLLYFTGQKRMARNILRKVLSFYAENPHNFASILVDSLKRGAKAAAAAIERHDFDALADALNGYWCDKKLLDNGSTNERVENIIERIRPWTSAVSLMGAGGGGFMLVLAKSAKAAAAIRGELTARPPSMYSRFYDFQIDCEGLKLELS